MAILAAESDVPEQYAVGLPTAIAHSRQRAARGQRAAGRCWFFVGYQLYSPTVLPKKLISRVHASRAGASRFSRSPSTRNQNP